MERGKSPLVGPMYNLGVWDKGGAAWVHVGDRRTLAGEEDALHHYHKRGRSLENGGCVESPTLLWRGAFFCIFHCSIGIGCLQVVLFESPLGELPKENTKAVRRVPQWSCTSIESHASATSDRGEVRANCSSHVGNPATTGLCPGRSQGASRGCHVPPPLGLVHGDDALLRFVAAEVTTICGRGGRGGLPPALLQAPALPPIIGEGRD